MMLHRRSLLAAAAAAAVAPRQTARATSITPDVIVIGAGAAGLAAAGRLTANGYTVLVLEARSRIGGRMDTSTAWPDLPLDLGASWIHGHVGNPLTAIANKLGIKRVPTYGNKDVLLRPGGAHADAAFDTLYKQAVDIVSKARAAANHLNKDISLADAVTAYLGRNYPTGDALVALNYYVNSIIEQEYAADWTKLSAWNYDDDGGFPGYDVLLKGGYVQIANYLATGLNIQLNQQVSAIAWSDTGVTVTTRTGSFAAPTCIVTLPLGILQSGAITFTPALPAAQQTALGKLSMGLLNKCYLRFPKAFWPKQSDWLEYLTLTKGIWAEWVSLEPGFKQPVLVGFNAGTEALAIERQDDATTVAGAMTALRSMFGNAIPDPLGYQITRWSQDPYTLGSYSYEPPGSSRATRAVLTRAFSPALFLAGEATHPKYPATVHGAYLSGQRAAGQVIAA